LQRAEIMLRCVKAIIVCALSAVLGACSPLGVINAFTPRDTYAATENIAYGTGERQRLDVYEPRGSATGIPPATGYPIVVFFYGGTWTSGTRAEYRFVGEALASRGIVAIIADYRLYPQVRYPDFLNDCASAVEWARRVLTATRSASSSWDIARALTTRP
jgi:acetyl esterase/lipase